MDCGEEEVQQGPTTRAKPQKNKDHTQSNNRGEDTSSESEYEETNQTRPFDVDWEKLLRLAEPSKQSPPVVRENVIQSQE